MNEYIPPPQVYNINKAAFENDGLRVFISGYKEKLLPWKDILAINVLTLNLPAKKEEIKKRSILVQENEQTISDLAQKLLEDLERYRHKGFIPNLFVDIFYRKGPAIYRVHTDRFNYQFLPSPQPHSIDNFINFVLLLLEKTPQALRTYETQGFLKGIENAFQKTTSLEWPEILDKTLVYKKEELLHYNEWLAQHLQRKFGLIYEENQTLKEKLTTPYQSSQTTSSSSGYRGPILLGGLGAIYFPIALYLWCFYRHSQNLPAIPISTSSLEIAILSLTGAVIATLLLLKLFLKSINLKYIFSLLFILIVFFLTYPWILIITKEPQFQAIHQQTQIYKKVENYRLQHKKLPPNLETLFHGIHPKDPWGNPWQYTVQSPQQYNIRSYGPDGLPGTADDL
ncbi:MAG: hypothetical protein D6805_02840 [Planctomycetota bacterium]|nr:MAG: hypothetical protein D6805_02840 [Planctomycetota bacterium]